MVYMLIAFSFTDLICLKSSREIFLEYTRSHEIQYIASLHLGAVPEDNRSFSEEDDLSGLSTDAVHWVRHHHIPYFI